MHSVPRWLLIFAVLLSLAALAFWPRWTVDDAYISYRYGKNWVETGELTWNPGESPKVEGYTGIFLPVLAAASIQLGIEPAETARWAGVLGFLLAIFSLWRIGKHLFQSEWAGSIMVLGWVLYPFHYTHAHSGLETMVFLGLLLFSMERIGQFWAKPSFLGALWTGILLLLLCLTRPEGLLLVISAAMVPILKARSLPTAFSWLQFGLAVLVFAVPASAYFLWRHQYYDAWLPNTFYAKAYAGWVNPEAAFAWFRFGIKFMAIPAAAIILSGWRMRTGANGPSTNHLSPSAKILGWTAAVFGGLYFMFYLKVNLYMNYEYRFFLPVLAAFWITIGYIIARFNFFTKYLSNNWLMYSSLIIALGFFVVLGIKVKENLYFVRYYNSLMEEEWKPIGKELHDRNPAGGKAAIYMDVGAIGYFSGWEILDMGRLNDRFLARENPDSTAVADYFFNWNADACVFTSYDSTKLAYIPEAEMLSRDPRFSKYRLVGSFGNSADFPYFQLLYLREDKAQLSVIRGSGYY